MLDPNNNCDGEVPLDRFGVLCQPSSTKGSDLVQDDEVARMRKEAFKVLCARSTRPLV